VSDGAVITVLWGIDVALVVMLAVAVGGWRRATDAAAAAGEDRLLDRDERDLLRRAMELIEQESARRYPDPPSERLLWALRAGALESEYLGSLQRRRGPDADD
jgi:hypothetical protein